MTRRSTLECGQGGCRGRDVVGAGFERETELRGDHDLVTDWCERFADEFLVDERAVGLGGVEERDAALGR